MAERVRVLLSEEEVDARIQEIGDQISKGLCRKTGSSGMRAEGRKLFYV